MIRNTYFDFITTDCGVTPHAQNTGISPSRISTASPKSGRDKSVIPNCSYRFCFQRGNTTTVYKLYRHTQIKQTKKKNHFIRKDYVRTGFPI